MSVRSLENLSEDELQELANTITDEEFEQLDELSKMTLSSYMGKSMDQYQGARHTGGNAQTKAMATMKKRSGGFKAAAKKLKPMLNKEENVEDDETLDEETAAQASIKTKSMDMAKIMSQMAGMSHNDITKLADILNQVGHEADKLPDRANATSNRNSVDAVADAKKATMFSVKEDLKELFAGQENLAEDFVNNIETLFEAAVNMRVALETEVIMEDQASIVEELVEERMADIEEKLDDYLKYVVEEWKEENALAIESGIRMNQMEAFMNDLYDLLAEHNIELPEDKVDVVEELMAEIDGLKQELNDQIEKNIENQKLIDDANREAAFDEVTEGLAATQIEKLRTLSEGIDFSDIDEFKKKVTTIRDHHFKEAKSSNLSEQIDNSDKNNIEDKKAVSTAENPQMKDYVQGIRDSLKFHR